MHQLGRRAACHELMVCGERSQQRSRRLPQCWQTAAEAEWGGAEVLGVASRTKLEAVSPACAGISRWRGHGGALHSVLLLVGCSKGFVLEQRRNLLT